MNADFKKFIAAVSKDTGLTPNDIAMQCIAATMNLPGMARYLDGAAPPSCQFDVSISAPAPAPAPAEVPADTSALEAEVARLKAEVESLRTPKAPKGNLADLGNLKAIVIDGTEVAVRSWRAGAMHMLGLLTAAGKKSDVSPGWFRDEATERTFTLASGDHAFASIVVGECEKRVRKVAEVMGLTVTLRLVAEDGTSQDVAL